MSDEPITNADLNQAIQLYIGYDPSFRPENDILAVRSAYPSNVEDLVSNVKKILARLYKVDVIGLEAFDRAGHEKIVARIHQEFPEFEDPAIESLSRCWQYWNRR